VLCEGKIVGRIMKAAAAPVGTPWLWTLAYSHLEGRTPTHGYAATREAAMGAFVKSWRRELVLRSGSPLSGTNRTLSRHRRMTESDPSATSARNFCCDAQRRSSATAW
jgi:hypothetical protein